MMTTTTSAHLKIKLMRFSLSKDVEARDKSQRCNVLPIYRSFTKKLSHLSSFITLDFE